MGTPASAPRYQPVAPTGDFSPGSDRRRKVGGVLGGAIVAGQLCGDVRPRPAVRPADGELWLLRSSVRVKRLSGAVLLASLPLSWAEAPSASANEGSQGPALPTKNSKTDCGD